MLDASALLALLNGEPGAEKLTPQLLEDATISTVNLAEVQSKLVKLIVRTSPLGLSLGDRACLALAMTLKAPVYTADRLWKNLKLGVRIHVVR